MTSNFDKLRFDEFMEILKIPPFDKHNDVWNALKRVFLPEGILNHYHQTEKGLEKEVLGWLILDDFCKSRDFVGMISLKMVSTLPLLVPYDFVEQVIKHAVTEIEEDDPLFHFSEESRGDWMAFG